EVLSNLLDNAEKYTRSSDDRTVRVALASTGSALALSVADRGPGVAPGVARRLFRPFARGGEDAPAGLGLGLALSRALVRAQGGDLVHANAPGGGAVFTATFPIAS